MREYRDLEDIHEIDENADCGNGISYYLLHHTVLKENSTTTKLRVVFNASYKIQSEKSLNNELLVGPIVQQDLLSILSRFRTYQIAMTADMAKMYKQILVCQSQRRLQRIL
ncbi:hypothetical protein KM043_018527 [Ampulex compressa]|nr:hypothetical protein KM043_018527 [Ampulex compressa]